MDYPSPPPFILREHGKPHLPQQNPPIHSPQGILDLTSSQKATCRDPSRKVQFKGTQQILTPQGAGFYVHTSPGRDQRDPNIAQVLTHLRGDADLPIDLDRIWEPHFLNFCSQMEFFISSQEDPVPVPCRPQTPHASPQPAPPKPQRYVLLLDLLTFP
jgi:hypothetical protein